LSVVAVVSVGIAAQMGKQDLQWRRVDSTQEAILSKKLSRTHAEVYFYVENRNDPDAAQFYMSIVGVCIKINLGCPLVPQKALVPWMFPPLGVLSFAFPDADHTFIDAFTAAGLITGRVGTGFGTEIFPEGIT